MKTLPNKNLKMALFDKDLTQRNLSFGTRIDEGRISRIIRGYELPNLDIQRAISKFLEMEPEELF